MTSAVHHGDPINTDQARQLQEDIRTEMVRLESFIEKIESAMEDSAGERGLYLLLNRQTTELDRLSRMTLALETRFGI